MLLIAVLMAFHLSFAIHYCGGHVASVGMFGRASGRCCCGKAGGEEAGCSVRRQEAPAFPPAGSLTGAASACCSDSYVTMETDDCQAPILSGPAAEWLAPFAFLPSPPLPFSETAALLNGRIIRPPGGGGYIRHGTDLLTQICVLRI
ncbi:MAG: hypothetical protein LBK22_07205 [Tannerella sp.]|nr:hypothetical protein [Tannerella sp.]